jgi:pimeloyl-ACP methyl ester carboxylesterase
VEELVKVTVHRSDRRTSAREWMRHGELLAVPDVGHWPFCENPGAFFPAVEKFLGR